MVLGSSRPTVPAVSTELVRLLRRDLHRRYLCCCTGTTGTHVVGLLTNAFKLPHHTLVVGWAPDHQVVRYSSTTRAGMGPAAAEAALLDELEASVQAQPDYLGRPPRAGGRRWRVLDERLEAAREEEEVRALSAAKQQRQSLSSRRRRRERSAAPLESLKSAIIDSKVAPFVATVPREVPPPLGRLCVRDFRTRRRCAPKSAAKDSVRVMAWNIERGYRLASVIASLRHEAADVLLLSEVDVGCARSQMVDVGAEIAAALGMCLVFATEKIRVNESASEDLVGDADAYDGVEGLAILSSFDVVDAKAVFLPDASKKNDPRKQRLALRATCLPFREASAPPVDIVVAHLDAFAGRSSRVDQFAPILDDWRIRKSQGRPTVIGGDFNTHNHGVTCMHPGMMGDDFFLKRLWRGAKLQPLSWGQTEAEWWQAAVFDDTSLVDPFDKSLYGQHNTHVHLAGLPLWGGKLDWLLFDNDFFHCADKLVSRANLASDHPYLRLDLLLNSSPTTTSPSSSSEDDDSYSD